MLWMVVLTRIYKVCERSFNRISACLKTIPRVEPRLIGWNQVENFSKNADGFTGIKTQLIVPGNCLVLFMPNYSEAVDGSVSKNSHQRVGGFEDIAQTKDYTSLCVLTEKLQRRLGKNTCNINHQLVLCARCGCWTNVNVPELTFA